MLQIKQVEGRMILQICLLLRMLQIMIGPHPSRGCPLPLLDSLAVMQAKDSESNSTTFIDDHHVEVSIPVIVPSPLRTTLLGGLNHMRILMHQFLMWRSLLL